MATFRFTDGERHVFRRRPAIRVSAWAADNLVVPDGPHAGGRFRLDVNPYLVEIMDTWGRPEVEEVDVCGSAQTGKTLAMDGCLAYSVDMRPGPKMLAMPDDETLDRVSKGKLRPLLRSCPPVRRLLTKTTGSQYGFKDGTRLYLASAQSPAQRAAISVQDLFLDEEALYRKIKGQGIPVLDFLERTRSYAHKRKIMRVSKPVGGEECSICEALESWVDEVREYEPRCPGCMEYQPMVPEQVVVVGGCTDPQEVERRKLGRYKCACCGYRWTDHARDMAVAAGRWRAREPVPGARRIGFHLPAILSRSVSISEVAASALRAEATDSPEVKQQHANGMWAEPYRPTEMATPQERVLELRDPDLPPGVVPKDAVALTCGVDTQQRSFFYTVYAWAPDLRSWLVEYDKLREWADVRALIHEKTWEQEGGGELPIWRAAIDTGGTRLPEGVATRTEEVYANVRAWGEGRLCAAKGRSREHYTPVSWTVLDRMPRTRTPIPGGLTLYLLDVHYLKCLVSRRMALDARQPICLHAKVAEDFARHMAAERLVRTREGKLQWERVDRENHWFDATVLAHACADGSWTPSLEYIAKKEAEQAAAPAAPTPRPQHETPGRSGRSSWINRRKAR